jgi:hypothetical protein
MTPELWILVGIVAFFVIFLIALERDLPSR